MRFFEQPSQNIFDLLKETASERPVSLFPFDEMDRCEKSRLHREFFLVRCTSLSSSSWLCLLSFTIQHIQYKHPCPGGIRTHSPSKRSALNPRLRPLGHWGHLIRSPDRAAHSQSLYHLSYRGPNMSNSRQCVYYTSL